ncbi:MAG: hypothetical protein Q8942_11515, partial [Bacillota bacterium]|nr:hypothetical protein [Bacillota bacterium]
MNNRIILVLSILLISISLVITSCSEFNKNDSTNDIKYIDARKEFLIIYEEIGESVIKASSDEGFLENFLSTENKARVIKFKNAYGKMKEIAPEKYKKDFDGV